MGRPQKEKNNYQKRFEQLYAEKRIDGNAGLLRKMYVAYVAYYKGKPDVSPDTQTWVNSQAPDLGKKIRGERAFTETDIKAIERALNMSWVDIVEPLPEKLEKKKEKKFEEKGIRFAAYIDEEWRYQELADSYDVDEYNAALCNDDEYGKTIIDYIIENKAENGLRFLINEGYLKCDTSLKFHGIYRSEELSEKLWAWIIDLDDSELFMKTLGEQNLFAFTFRREQEGEKFLENMIKAANILKALCQERVYRESKVKYMPSLLLEALSFSLRRNKQVVAQRIISAYTRFIEDQTAAFQNEINQESNHRLRAYQHDHSSQVEIMQGKNLVMYVWDPSELSKKYVGFEDQIEALQISNIINRLEVKNLSAMEYGDSFVKDGIYYVKKKLDLSLEALRYLTEEKGCKFLPTYIGEERGVTKIHAYRSAWYGVKFSELGEMLGEIHLLSQEKLGADRVYMYSRGFARGFGYMHSGGARIITNWQICDIGSPMLDIVTAFLNFGGEDTAFSRFIEKKEASYQELSLFLGAYPDQRVTENFGDKFNEELDRMLKNEIQGVQGKNNDAIEKLYMAKGFAEIYRDKLNLITKRGREDEEGKQ